MEAEIYNLILKLKNPNYEDKYYLEAFNNAKKLDNEDYVTFLIKFIENEKQNNLKKIAYFLLAQITKNTNNQNSLIFLINQLNHEKDNSIIVGEILDWISSIKIPENIDIKAIIEASKSEEQKIRHKAINILHNTNNPIARKRCEEILEKSNDDFDLIYANFSLWKIWNKESIKYIQKNLDHPKLDVSWTALDAIAILWDKSNIDIFLKHLEKWKSKFSAMLWAVKFWDSKIIPNVVKRVKNIVSIKRKNPVFDIENKTELIYAMDFLSKYINSSTEVKNLFIFLNEKKQDFLVKEEKDWLIKSINL